MAQLHDKVAKMRQQRGPMPDALQGVTKDRIRSVLQSLDLGTNGDLVDCVFALLDDETESWFTKAPKGAKVSAGASTVNRHAKVTHLGGL